MTRILSLYDDPDMLGLLRLILDLAGYEHLRTADVGEALSILHAEEIDLFIQNIMRSGIDGWELYRIMKQDENLRLIPVLFLSGAWPSELAVERYSRYGDGYLTMPFAPQELLRTAAEMLQRHGKHIPTEEERRTRYKQVREELSSKFKMSEEQLDAIYERTTGFLADF